MQMALPIAEMPTVERAQAKVSRLDQAEAVAEQLEQWHRAISTTFCELASDSRRPDAFKGSLRTIRRNGLAATKIDAAAHQVWRGPREIELGPTERLFFVRQVSGSAHIEHLDGQIDLHVGESVLLHFDRPYFLQFGSAFEQICVQVPERWLWRRLGGQRRSALGRKFIGSTPVGHVLNAATDTLLMENADGFCVSDLFLDTLARALHISHSAQAPASSLAARSSGERLRSFVLRHFRDEGLSPADAAAEIGCSVRNIHKMCNSLGTTFGQLLLDTRVSAASEALSKGRGEAARISDVAYECGFSDLSHFCRAFKSRFGMAPMEFRRKWI